MFKTVTIQIGNSDDKLTQVEWHQFVREMTLAVHAGAYQVHFFGGPINYEPYQNAAWIIEIGGNCLSLRMTVEEIRKKYKQDSAAWTEGHTEFI